MGRDRFVAANTLAAALAICDDIFCDRPHPVLARTKLYKQTRRANETFEEFLYDLHHIVKDCRLGDQEDLRIMEPILTSCNDQDLFEKILAAYPGPPTLNNVLLAKRHEAAKEEFSPCQTGFKRSKLIPKQGNEIPTPTASTLTTKCFFLPKK